MNKPPKRVIINRDMRKSSKMSFISSNQSQQIKNNQRDIGAQSTKQLIKQIQIIKKKNQKLLLNNKFLEKKLKQFGCTNQISNQIIQEINNIDQKVNLLESAIEEKKSQYFNKVRDKIIQFIKFIEFESAQNAIYQINTQIGLIDFLIDIFNQRYQQIHQQIQQFKQIVNQNRQHSINIHIKKLSRQNQCIKQQKQHLKKHIRNLQIQIYNLNKLNHQKKTLQNYQQNQSIQLYQRQIQSLQFQNMDLKKKINQIQSKPINQDIQIQKFKRIIDQLQCQNKQYRVKIQILQEDISRIQKQQFRLKQRFRNLQKHKNQRIKILQRQLDQHNGYQINGDHYHQQSYVTENY